MGLGEAWEPASLTRSQVLPMQGCCSRELGWWLGSNMGFGKCLIKALDMTLNYLSIESSQCKSENTLKICTLYYKMFPAARAP